MRLPDRCIRVFAYREMIRNLVRRDLVERYQRSPIGIALALSMPVLITCVFSLVFAGLMPGRDGADYPLRVFLAYVAWDYLARTLSIAADTLRGHTELIGKVYFPLEVLPIATCLSVLVQFGLALLLFLCGNVIFGTGLHWTQLWLPVLVALEVVLVVGLALAVATLGVVLQDFGHLLAVGLMVWFYGSAVFYAPDIVPSAGVRAALQWNPLLHLFQAMRATGIDGVAPRAAGVGYAAVAAVLSLLVGGWLIGRFRHVVTEVLG